MLVNNHTRNKAIGDSTSPLVRQRAETLRHARHQAHSRPRDRHASQWLLH